MPISTDVAASPEQAWAAVATGGGISAWFVPTVLEPREGGAMTMEAIPGDPSPATVTAYEPPRRFAFGEEGAVTTFTVEAEGDGARVTVDGPEDQQEGWSIYLDVLRVHLQRFAGKPFGAIHAAGEASGSRDEAFAGFAQTLGLQDAEVGSGAAVRAPGASTLEGAVISAGPYWVAFRVVHPVGGMLVACTFPVAEDRAKTILRIHLYDERGAEIAQTDADAWRAVVSA